MPIKNQLAWPLLALVLVVSGAVVVGFSGAQTKRTTKTQPSSTQDSSRVSLPTATGSPDDVLDALLQEADYDRDVANKNGDSVANSAEADLSDSTELQGGSDVY